MKSLRLPRNFPLSGCMTEISPGDTMYVTSEHYVSVGLSALKIFEWAITEGFTRSEGLRTILDLPCGHGRVARILRARFPGAELTACDIDHAGVDFCVDRLGAKGVYSTADFDKLDLGGLYDLIWVGSLITHLNPSDTVKFLRCMERSLSEDGVLIISNHGKLVADRIAAENPSSPVVILYNIVGYGCDADSYIKRYGGSIISRHWLEGFFAGEPCGIIAYLDHEWDNNHDVLFVKKRPLLPIEFDAKTYLMINQDVADTGIDPERHYLMFGHKEGRRYR